MREIVLCNWPVPGALAVFQAVIFIIQECKILSILPIRFRATALHLYDMTVGTYTVPVILKGRLEVGCQGLSYEAFGWPEAVSHRLPSYCDARARGGPLMPFSVLVQRLLGSPNSSLERRTVWHSSETKASPCLLPLPHPR